MVSKLKLEKNVEFLGRVPHDDTVPKYQEADLFVLPSLNEGMSNAMLEALATGLPIVTTNTGGASELVKVGENGFIVEFENSRDIAEKIRTIMDDKDLMESMSRKSLEMSKEMSWQSVSGRYVDEYEKIIRQK